MNAGLTLPLLKYLADGEPRELESIWRAFIASGMAVDVACGVDAALLSLSEDGLVAEELKRPEAGQRRQAWYLITAGGRARITEIENAPAPPPVVRQRAMF